VTPEIDLFRNITALYRVSDKVADLKLETGIRKDDLTVLDK